MARIPSPDLQLIEAIREILLNKWDPICIPEEFRASNQDEYDLYIDPLVEMVQQKKTKEDIASYLLGIEVRAMGVRRKNSRAEAAAEAVFSLIDKEE